MSPDELERRIDALYAGPSDRFVAERDRLARELGGSEHAQGRERVKALRKPSSSAWLANQLFRKARPHFDALWAAGDGLQVAQEAVLSGAGREAMTEAAARENAAIEVLLADAERLANEVGQPLTAPTLARVTTSLRTLARVPAARVGFRGQLTQDLEPAGVEALLGADPGARPAVGDRGARAQRVAPGEPPPADSAAVQREQAAARERAQREAWARQRRLVDQHQQNARRIEQELARREREARAAAEQVTHAEQVLERARAAREAAERTAQRARLACETARTEAVVAERDLAALESATAAAAASTPAPPRPTRTARRS